MVAPVLAAATGVVSLVQAVSPIVEQLIALIPDPNARAKAQEAWSSRVLDMVAASDARQSAVNEREAQHPSIFVAGARPAALWVCVVALALNYVIGPYGMWFAQVLGYNPPPLPTLDGMLWELVFALLGVAGMRSLDKRGGVATVAVSKLGGVLGRKK